MHADVVFNGGAVRTGAVRASVHDALAVVGGRISAPGAAVPAARGPLTGVVDRPVVRCSRRSATAVSIR
ncbi:hypothetical protein GCM10010269_67830 [Streptomyces humidus]|uniref:Uncharacterized protein n=1 Tax=Streptomyces humidus TaxID=52259 RepID=A0A918G657_9ACTN|nr:hypothetical protein [Streptomyces humidus]GGS19237.1 hypothetical protein GCM10010269_67830 [Streptomyces humidus]